MALSAPALNFGVYPGFGEYARDERHYSQAVQIGDRIEISGQGGWDNLAADPIARLKSGELDIDQEIAIAFENVETALKTIDGSKGWSQVFRINSFHTNMSDATMNAMVGNFRKYMPHHQPIWTMTGAHQLAIEGMHVEIEVAAYNPKGHGCASKDPERK